MHWGSHGTYYYTAPETDTSGPSQLKYLRCINRNGGPAECHVRLRSGVQGEPRPLLHLRHPPINVQSPPLMGIPDQLKKRMFLVCWVCDLHFVFIVFTIINLRTNQCAYQEKKRKRRRKQLSNVSCRSSDFIHSAPFIGFVSDFYSFIFFVGFYLFFLSLYFNSTWELGMVYIIELVVGELH